MASSFIGVSDRELANFVLANGLTQEAAREIAERSISAKLGTSYRCADFQNHFTTNPEGNKLNA